jgi:hypothetical protein
LLTTKNITRKINKEKNNTKKSSKKEEVKIFNLEKILKNTIQNVKIIIKKEKESRQKKIFFLKNLKFKLKK